MVAEEWNGANIGEVSSSKGIESRKARTTHLSDVSVRYVRSPSDRHAKNLSLNCISACPTNRIRGSNTESESEMRYESNPRIPLPLAAPKRNENITGTRLVARCT